MFQVRKDIQSFLKTIPQDVTLVAATKYLDGEEMKKLYACGVKCFGENRADVFLQKHEALKAMDVQWHFIGHLQTNKAKKIISRIDVLHSLDSLDLAKLIQKERNTPLDCFVEVSVNLEEKKNGVPYPIVHEFVSQLKQFDKVHLVGLMMMARKGVSSEEQLREFMILKNLKTEVEQQEQISLPYLSMGMSQDYLMAMKAGATHIRLGHILMEEK